MRPKPPARRLKGGANDLAAAERAPRPVVALSDSFAAGVAIPPHLHERAQLVFAERGTMSIRANGCFWILPPSHALWIPAGVVHGIRMNGPVEMRTLYIAAPGVRGARECEVLFVSPLLRELILRAAELPALYDEAGMAGRVMSLILDEVARLSARPLGLRMPGDPRLMRLCESVLRRVGAHASIAELGAAVGLSERSVIRLFPRETGMSFRRWHNQARLLKAFELFAERRSVTQVALDLGYAGPGAFAKMFRRSLGKSPLEMLGK